MLKSNKNKKNIIKLSIASFLPIILLLIVYYFLDMFPFGELSLLTIDLDGQYVSFFAYLKRALSGEDSLLYSFSKTMSGEMVGLSSYYLLSPFNVLFLGFDISKFPIAILIITLLKTSAASLSMWFYLKNKRIPKPWTYLLGVVYSMSGYVIAYQQNLMWLDGVIILPLIVLGIDNLFTNKKTFLYSLALLFAIITNYYIGFMLCIFSVLYFVASSLGFVIKNLHDKKKSLEDFFRPLAGFIMGSLLAGGMAAVVLIPIFYSLQGGKAGFDLSVLTLKSNFTLLEFLSKFVVGSFSFHQIQAGLPNVFVPSAIGIASVLFLFNKKLPISIKIKYAFLLLTIFLSFKFYGLNLIWHGMNEPAWFPYRYSFIFSFLLIVMTAMQLKKKNFSLYQLGIAFLLISLLLYKIKAKQYEFLNDTNIFITFVLIGIWVVLFALINRFSKKRIFKVVLFGFLSTELVLNGYGMLSQNNYYEHNRFVNHVNQNEPLIEKLKPKDDEFYRIEKNYEYSKNDPLLYGYAGLSHYSSSEKNNVKEFLGNLGYHNYGTWARYSYGSTVLTDSLMGIKYRLSTVEIPYLNLLNQQGDIFIYENPYYFPLGFFASNTNIDTKLSTENVFEFQNDLFSNLIGYSDIFTPLNDNKMKKRIDNIEIKTEGNREHYEKIDNEEDAFIHYYLSDVKGEMINFYFPSSSRSGVEIYVNGELLSTDLSVYNYTINTFLAKNENVQVSLKLLDSEVYYDDELFYTNDIHILEETKERVTDRGMEINDFYPTAIKGTLSHSEEEELLVLTIPYDSSWNIRIDGEKIEPVNVFDTLLGIPVPSYSHEITLEYQPKGLIAGSLTSFISFILYMGYFIIKRKKIKND